MGKITVRDISSEPQYLRVDEDGQLRCEHINAEVEEPCCSGYENGVPSCGCGGLYTVSCPHKCELNETEVEEILADYTPRRARRNIWGI